MIFPLLRLSLFCCNWLCRFATALKLTIDLTPPLYCVAVWVLFPSNEKAKLPSNRIALAGSISASFNSFLESLKLTLHWFWFYLRLSTRIRSSNKWKTRNNWNWEGIEWRKKRYFSDIFASASDFPLLACAFSRENLSSSGISAQKSDSKWKTISEWNIFENQLKFYYIFMPFNSSGIHMYWCRVGWKLLSGVLAEH